MFSRPTKLAIVAFNVIELGIALYLSVGVALDTHFLNGIIAWVMISLAFQALNFLIVISSVTFNPKRKSSGTALAIVSRYFRSGNL